MENINFLTYLPSLSRMMTVANEFSSVSPYSAAVGSLRWMCSCSVLSGTPSSFSLRCNVGGSVFSPEKVILAEVKLK